MILYFAYLLVFGFVVKRSYVKKAMGRSRESEKCKVILVICSTYFKPGHFAPRLNFQEEEGILLTSWLKRDEFAL